MIIPAILAQKYENYREIIELAANIAKETLQNHCDKTGYAFASRIKTIESLAEKIGTGRYKSWSALDDLFACTIIVPTLHQEEEVSKFCRSVFKVLRTGWKICWQISHPSFTAFVQGSMGKDVQNAKQNAL